MNFPTILDNLISMVVVLLVLSLVVQSVQSGLKKLFKIKSRQIEDSLVDLFEHVLDRAPGKMSWWSRLWGSMPFLRLFFRGKRPADVADQPVKDLYNGVMKKFKDLGRVSQFGQQMLNSVAKEDLLKVLDEVGPQQLAPGFEGNLAKVEEQINTLQTLVEKVDATVLSGDTSAKFAKLYASIIPLLNDSRNILSGTTVRPEVLIGDVKGLREIRLEDVFNLLGEIQAKLQTELETARQSAASAGEAATGQDTSAGARVSGLEDLVLVFKNIASVLANLRREFDSAMAPLRGKLGEVESWFDTVMQSFEERYARGMKTWTIVIGFVVVVFLNANFFRLYTEISSNEAIRASLLQSESQLKALRAAVAKSSIENKPRSPTQLLNESEKTIGNEAATYSSFGFQPLSWQQLRNWWNGEGPWKENRGDRVLRSSKIFLGWMIMTLLLSVGAPFWEDTLESLFGLKGILRSSSETKNVETRSGAGQPKT